MIKKNIKFSIAIDGSSASGKTTGSKIISKKFKFKLLSSGKLYRYLAYKIIKNKNRLRAKKETWGKLNRVSERRKAEKNIKVWVSLGNSNKKK